MGISKGFEPKTVETTSVEPAPKAETPEGPALTNDQK